MAHYSNSPSCVPFRVLDMPVLPTPPSTKASSEGPSHSPIPVELQCKAIVGPAADGTLEENCFSSFCNSDNGEEDSDVIDAAVLSDEQSNKEGTANKEDYDSKPAASDPISCPPTSIPSPNDGEYHSIRAFVQSWLDYAIFEKQNVSSHPSQLPDDTTLLELFLRGPNFADGWPIISLAAKAETDLLNRRSSIKGCPVGL